MAPVTTFQQLVAFLVENNFPHGADAAAQIVELPSNAAPLPGNLYIRWETKIPFIQIIHLVIDNLPADRLKELETAVVVLNNALELPGFGVEHANRRLYCRFTVPVIPPEGISSTTLNQLGMACVAHARDFLAAFQAVVAGRPGSEIVNLAREAAQAKAAAQSAGGEKA
jgi:hypothetical protein